MVSQSHRLHSPGCRAVGKQNNPRQPWTTTGIILYSMTKHKRLIAEWQDVKIWEDSDKPGVYELRLKRDRGKLKKGKVHSLAYPDGQGFLCDSCHCEHIIPWEIISFIKYQMQIRDLSTLLQFCIAGNPFNFWQPGAPPFEGRKTLLVLWELVE